MMRIVLQAAAALVLGVTTAAGDDLDKLWPVEVPKPAGLKTYTPAAHSQRLVILNGQPHNHWWPIDRDHPFANAAPELNPNRIFPWRVPGGLDHAAGWVSIKAASIPSAVKSWQEQVAVPAARLPLPKRRWAFPEGTVFVELLAQGGRLFELRSRTKTADGWLSRVEFEDKSARPAYYHGAGFACSRCHAHAGASLQYGITVRGDDETFSWVP